MEELSVTSARLQKVVMALVFLTPLAFALLAVVGHWHELLNVPASIALDSSRISGFNLLALIAVSAIKPAAYVVAFWRLYKLLGLYREGIVFTRDNVAAIRRIGWALVGIDIATMLQTLVAGPVLTALAITEGHISVTLEVGFLVVGLFIIVVAHVMNLGRELKEQDSLVI